MDTVFALVDCNNFYASCERLFRPDLAQRPILVLSNNDGCVVARSSEAKALGIKMGVPVFQIKELIRRHRILTFSSNYALYADLSQRVMQTLEQLAPRVEVYSIDEAFLDLSQLPPDPTLLAYGHHIRATVAQWTGIRVCVGMAPTKTLAKLANHAAKQYPATQGVVDLRDPARQQRLLAITPASEVWGVGRKLSQRLAKLGVQSALDLANCSPHHIRGQFSVVLARTVRELNGESCLALDEVASAKQQIICSRSFGRPITRQADMLEALCEYSARATEKLRQEGQQAKVLSLFIRTSLFQSQRPIYSAGLTGQLWCPSSDSRDFMALARQLLGRLWQDGHRYAKAGVILSDFSKPEQRQMDLFDEPKQAEKRQALMQVVDHINHQQGPSRVFFASQGLNPDWRMKRGQVSPAYTTRWDQLPRVK